MRFLQGLSLAVIATALVFSCGKKKDDDEGTPSVAASNPTSAAYPTSLAISAFPNSTATTSLALLAETNSTPAAKNDEAAKMMRGEAASCVPAIFAKDDKDGDAETCYEFDQDMIYGLKTTQLGTKDGKTSTGAACPPVFARNNIKRIEGQVDRSLGLIAAGLCDLKKSGKAEKPAVGASIDLTANIKSAFGDKMTAVTAAKITRRADNADGSGVFETKISVTRKDGVAMDITVIHSPKNEDNTKYNGVMFFSNDESKGGSTSMKRMVSIQYDRSSDGKIKYSLRTARVATALASSAIDSSGVLDFNTGAGSDGSYTGYSNANDAFSGMVFVGFQGDSNTNEGTFAYWQNPGGNYTERARGMIAALTYDADAKVLKGCATMGAAGSKSDGLSIRKSIKDGKSLEPNGAYHPFFHTETDGSCSAASAVATDSIGSYYTRVCGTENRKWYVPKDSGANGTTFVTEQQPAFHIKTCFKQNATSGEYELDTSNADLGTAGAGFVLVSATDTSKKISAPTPPTVDVKKN